MQFISEVECNSKNKDPGVDSVVLNFFFDIYYPSGFGKVMSLSLAFFSPINMYFRVVVRNKVSKKCSAECLA